MEMFNEKAEGTRLLELLCETVAFVPRISWMDALVIELNKVLKTRSINDKQKKQIIELVRSIKNRKSSSAKNKPEDFDALKKIVYPTGKYPADAELEQVQKCWDNLFNADALSEDQLKVYAELALFCRRSMVNGWYAINFKYINDATNKPYYVLAKALAQMSLKDMKGQTTKIEKILDARKLELDDCFFRVRDEAEAKALAAKQNVNEQSEEDYAMLPPEERDKIIYAVTILSLIPAMRAVLVLGSNLCDRLLEAGNDAFFESIMQLDESAFNLDDNNADEVNQQNSGNGGVDLETFRKIVQELVDEDQDYLGQVKPQTLDVFDNQLTELSAFLAEAAKHRDEDSNIVKLPRDWVLKHEYGPETLIIAAMIYRKVKKPDEYVTISSGGLEALGFYGKPDIHADAFFNAAQKENVQKKGKALLKFTTIEKVSLVALTEYAFKQMSAAEQAKTTCPFKYPNKYSSKNPTAAKNPSEDSAAATNPSEGSAVAIQDLLKFIAACEEPVAPDFSNDPSEDSAAATNPSEDSAVAIQCLSQDIAACEEPVLPDFTNDPSEDSAAATNPSEDSAVAIQCLSQDIAACKEPVAPDFSNEKVESIGLEDQGGTEVYRMLKPVGTPKEDKPDVLDFRLFDQFRNDDTTQQQPETDLKKLKAAIKEHCLGKTSEDLDKKLREISGKVIDQADLQMVCDGPDIKSKGADSWIKSYVRPLCLALLCHKTYGVVVLCKMPDLKQKLSDLVDKLTVEDVQSFVEEVSTIKPAGSTNEGQITNEKVVWYYCFKVGDDRDEDAQKKSFAKFKGEGKTKASGVCLFSTWAKPADNGKDIIVGELLHDTLRDSNFKPAFADRLWWPLCQRTRQILQPNAKLSQKEQTLDYMLTIYWDNEEKAYSLNYTWITVSDNGSEAVVKKLSAANSEQKDKQTLDTAIKISDNGSEAEVKTLSDTNSEKTDTQSLDTAIKQTNKLRTGKQLDKTKRENYKMFSDNIGNNHFKISIAKKRHQIPKKKHQTKKGPQITIYPFFSKDITKLTIIGSLQVTISQ